MNTDSNRRKSVRQKVSDSAVVITPFGVCEFVDISSGGMLLADRGNVEPSQEFSLDILTSDGSFNEMNVPVKVAWEQSFPHPIFTFNMKKKIGLEFNKLSPQQQIRLDVFVKNQEAARR